MLDTHVWLDLLVFDDPAVAPLASALQGGHAMALVEPRILAELERVLAYPALALPGEARRRVLDGVARWSRAVPVAVPAPPAPRCGDPDDQMFVDLALAERADALLSRDGAVLRLASRLRREGIEVTTPAAWCAGRADQISKR